MTDYILASPSEYRTEELRNGCQALATIKESSFRGSRSEISKNFDILFKTFTLFKKQKGLNIVEHLELINEIVDYVKNARVFKKFEKNLIKNVLIKCIIDPLTDIMKSRFSELNDSGFQILAANNQNIQALNKVLINLTNVNV